MVEFRVVIVYWHYIVLAELREEFTDWVDQKFYFQDAPNSPKHTVSFSCLSQCSFCVPTGVPSLDSLLSFFYYI